MPFLSNASAAYMVLSAPHAPYIVLSAILVTGVLFQKRKHSQHQVMTWLRAVLCICKRGAAIGAEGQWALGPVGGLDRLHA